MLRLITFLLGLLLSSAAPAFAAEIRAYDPAIFQTARDSGAPILVDIAATWCPTCKAQKPIIEELAARSEFSELLVLEVDFDSQKDVAREFGAMSQSTLIVFRGQDETGRSVGDTDPETIELLVRSAFQN